MRAIDKPNYTASDVFECCISNYRSNEKNSFLKTRLDSTTPLIVEAESEYEECANEAEWYKISTCEEAVGEVSSKEMKNVYKAKLTHQKSPGYHIYNKIRASAPNNICPFCGQRTVTTLDHYLPQGKYLKLVVTPINLIPACADCNKIKLSDAPANASEQVLPPYFDSTTDYQWLFARVIPAD